MSPSNSAALPSPPQLTFLGCLMGSLWTAGWERWKSSPDLWQSCPWARRCVGTISAWRAAAWALCWAGQPRCPWAVSSSAFLFFASCQFSRPQLACMVCFSLTFRKCLDQNVLGCFFPQPVSTIWWIIHFLTLFLNYIIWDLPGDAALEQIPQKACGSPSLEAFKASARPNYIWWI